MFADVVEGGGDCFLSISKMKLEKNKSWRPHGQSQGFKPNHPRARHSYPRNEGQQRQGSTEPVECPQTDSILTL